MASLLLKKGCVRQFFKSCIIMSPRPLVICGPSGVGKSTLLKRLMGDYPDTFGFSVSHTTRLPRVGEENGREYHFTDKETFLVEKEAGTFLETAEFSGNNYGTSYNSLLDVLKGGKWCILDIEMQGVKQIKESSVLKESNYNPVYMFIKPPSLEHLKERLTGRKTDSEEAINKRLNKAAEEIEYGVAPNNFDIIVVNDELESAYSCLKSFLDPLIQSAQDS